jgi:hypothetical protein
MANKAVFARQIQWVEAKKWLGARTLRKVPPKPVRRDVGDEPFQTQRSAVRDQANKGATETHVGRGIVELALKCHESLVARRFRGTPRGSDGCGMIFVTH